MNFPEIQKQLRWKTKDKRQKTKDRFQGFEGKVLVWRHWAAWLVIPTSKSRRLRRVAGSTDSQNKHPEPTIINQSEHFIKRPETFTFTFTHT